MATLFRKRLIPDECIALKDDIIVHIDDNCIITKWKTIRPKDEFSHGCSYYCLKEGWKISKFYKQDNSIAYIYCDIIDTHFDKKTSTYIFTDLLADVIIENSGFVRIVDLDELADACSQNIITNDMLVTALHRLNDLLTTIYTNHFTTYIDYLNSFNL